MSKIQVLDRDTIEQIAAGEVIDRPASIVKELIENSIDAKATMISIEIKDGGMSLIRITDNGIGIEKDDIRVAFLRHATSKIKNALDLATISSLGFRGEALSSIAAVCQVELITKTAGDLTAVRYKIEGGKEKLFEEIGAPQGTTFLVRNIFYNTPARRKFLKTAQTEAGYISGIIEKIALSHPEISIQFVNNGQAKLHTSGNGKLKETIYQIFGKNVTEHLTDIDVSNDMIHMSGCLGKAIISRANRSFENYFVNGRYIKSSLISKAIEDAYKSILMQHRYPFTVLNFEIDAQLLDVNVHPSKMELRFRKGETIYPWITEKIHQVLMERPNIIKAEIEPERHKTLEVPKMPEPFETQRLKMCTDSESEKELYQNTTDTDLVAEIPQYSTSVDVPLQKSITVKNEQTPVQQELLSDYEDFLSESAKPKHQLIGQVFDTYWIVEYSGKMYIIDQHAAHEKVMFESLMKKLQNKEVRTQMMNPSIVLNLSMSEAELVNLYSDNFREIGFEIESFGGGDFVVRGVPSDLYSLNSQDVLMDIIDNLSQESGKMVPDIITDKIASMSCKAAVKGNRILSAAEMDTLITQLLSLENPYNCPHGRPTIIAMSKYELDKKFKRIV